MKHNTKTLVFTALLSGLLWGTLPQQPLYADVLYVPETTLPSKYQNLRLCQRNFTVEAPQGYVDYFYDPEVNKSYGQLKNGATVHIEKTWQEGPRKWGLFYTENGKYSYFVRMDYLKPLYDYRAFYEEHRQEFIRKPLTFKNFSPNKPIIFWTYPNSGQIKADALGDLESGFTFDLTYRDQQGRLWGYITYYRAIRSGWICLSAPHKKDLKASAPHKK